MVYKAQKGLVKLCIVLSIIGILISLYLLENHFAPPAKGSICDFGETVSCSLVNTSVFSEIFHVPAALLGALWFVSIILLCWKALSDKRFIPLMLAWSVVGVLSVIYFVVAEIILKAICPFCTVVHVIVLTLFVISIVLYKKSKAKLTSKLTLSTIRTAAPWLAVIAILNILPFILFNISTGPQENYDALAQCMTEKGVVMYGSFRCSVCARTRAMFGDSFQYVKEIECHPQGKNAQTALCLSKKIEGTPTWVLEKDSAEIKRAVGFLSIDELRQFSGCTDAS